MTTVFIDFDNTITPFDVFDRLIETFACNDSWIEFEKRWASGKIGSKECLLGQWKATKIGQKELHTFLDAVPVDPYFKKITQLLKDANSRLIIESDNFDYIINRVLSAHKITGYELLSNRMIFSKGKARMSFPFENSLCLACAHCKTKNLFKNVSQDSIIIYVGDGRSDICPAECADVVFAKDQLAKHFKHNKFAFVPFKDLSTVYDYLRRSL